MDETTYTVKIIHQTDDTAVIGGYGVIFGGRDLEGETFTKNTDFMLDLVPVKPVYYDHSLHTKVNNQLGVVSSIDPDDTGLFIQAEIDKHADYASAVLKLVEKGVLGYSTGAVSHLARYENSTIKQWPMVEVSLTATPAEPRTVGIERIKQLAETDDSLKALIPESEQENASEQATVEDVEQDEILEPEQPADEALEVKTMTEEVKPVEKQDEKPALTIEDIKAAFKAEFEPLNKRMEKLEDTPINPAGVAGKAVNVVTDTEHWKYGNYSAQELALTAEFLKMANATNMMRNAKMARPASEALYKALAMRLESDEAKWDDNLARATQAMKIAGIKANELNQSTLANYGDEWVGVAYSGNLWESIRHETFVLGRLPQIEFPAGAESMVLPLESTDPVWYNVAQASAMSANPGGIATNTVTASKLGTANTTMTLGKMGARTLWTGELDEDSVLPFANQLRMQLVKSGAEYLESLLIDGDTDTSATTNINDIGGTPAATDYFTILNGFRKSPIITTTANSRDGGALTVDDYLETVKLMGNAGKNALDRSKVSFIIDPSTHWKTLELTEVKTQDVFSAPTIENGALTRIWGYEVINSAHMCKGSGTGLSNSAGKIDLDTPANNTLGQILAVRWDQWQFGWRRRMTIETNRIAAADSTEIVALMRFGMVQRDTEASAISYNLTV